MQADGVIALSPTTMEKPELFLDALEDARVIADRTFSYMIQDG